MMRCATALLLLVACDAETLAPPTPAHSPHKLTRADLDHFKARLPRHGFAVQTYGVGDYIDLELVDLDAKTMRVIADNTSKHGEPHVDQTLALGTSDLKRLGELSVLAWHEEPHGTMPSDYRSFQDLAIVDDDEVFDLRGDVIDAPGNTVRPNASALVHAVLELARTPLAQLAPPPPKHAHSLARSAVPTAETPAELPLHGVAVHSWGMTGDQTIVIDADKNTLRVVSNLMGKPPRDDTWKRDPKQVADVMQLALAAWHEDGSAMPTATDVREDLFVLDGDEAFYLSGHPIAANGKAGRPLAVKAVDAVYRAAR